jgi:hypothetical protein
MYEYTLLKLSAMLIALKSAHKAHSMSYHHAMIRNVSSGKEERVRVGGK